MTAEVTADQLMARLAIAYKALREIATQSRSDEGYARMAMAALDRIDVLDRKDGLAAERAGSDREGA